MAAALLSHSLTTKSAAQLKSPGATGLVKFPAQHGYEFSAPRHTTTVPALFVSSSLWGISTFWKVLPVSVVQKASVIHVLSL